MCLIYDICSRKWLSCSNTISLSRMLWLSRLHMSPLWMLVGSFVPFWPVVKSRWPPAEECRETKEWLPKLPWEETNIRGKDTVASKRRTEHMLGHYFQSSAHHLASHISGLSFLLFWSEALFFLKKVKIIITGLRTTLMSIQNKNYIIPLFLLLSTGSTLSDVF